MSKKVSFTKPQRTRGATPLDEDEWVSSGVTSDEESAAGAKKQKTSSGAKKAVAEEQEFFRFTIDIPGSLHAQIKAKCALKRVKMKDEIQALLERHFA